jgi:hypothetical protein
MCLGLSRFVVIASLLGVAGGEFLIPTLVLLFGADIKLAGSLSCSPWEEMRTLPPPYSLAGGGALDPLRAPAQLKTPVLPERPCLRPCALADEELPRRQRGACAL